VRFREPNDPFWDAFINRPPADPNNLITHAFENAQPGGVNPVRSEVHSPNVMSGHVKELGRFFGADRVGIVELAANPFGDAAANGPVFAIVCTLRTEHDTRNARGIGGQAPALKGLFVTFNLSAYIKEMGYRASRSSADSNRLAAVAGVGMQGREQHVAEVVYTDLPLAADEREAAL
jgi:hypothetical protein